MHKPLFDRLVHHLLPEMNDPANRRALLTAALVGSPLLDQIDWTGAATPFTQRLVKQLDDYGDVAPDRPALVALLEELKRQVGVDRQREIDRLMLELTTGLEAQVEGLQQFIRLQEEALAGELPPAERQERTQLIAGARAKLAALEQVKVGHLPPAFAAVLRTIRDDEADPAFLSQGQWESLIRHSPTDLTQQRLGQIAAWSLPRYALDKRFVTLTLLLDKGEATPQRWQAEESRFNDLREVLASLPDHPALVLLGAPGSGKSTLLRRFQMDCNIDQLRADGPTVTFFISLNRFRAEAEPRAWLEAAWRKEYPALPPLADYLRRGRVILLLDALNEMPHSGVTDYHRRVGLWRDLIREVVGRGNRAIFACRSLDYSASLSSKALRVPQIEVQPMSPEQVRRFIELYSPEQAESLWAELAGTPQFDLFRTPLYLKMLLEQVEQAQRLPKGKAELFTTFVRQQLRRNLDNPLFGPNELLVLRDHTKLARNRWRSPFELPERGRLLPRLSQLAFTMQESGLETEGALVRVDYDDACQWLACEEAEDILKAGLTLALLDEDVGREEITFFHQLLQEYFAARQVARAPDPSLVRRAWSVEAVSPPLAETLAGLADGDPLPPLPQSGWEETTLTAAPLAADPTAFIRALMAANLPLAARCAASPEVSLDPVLTREIQTALIARTQNMKADLRARIAAGLALGELGDPRFERHTGPHGDYLRPPLVAIPGGTYPIGLDDGPYDDEKPAHTVELAAFEIGQFPVTNAEYALFMAAGGYEDEQWWETDEAKAWLRGEGSTEGSKQQWRDNRQTLQSWTEEHFQNLVTQNRITSQQADDWLIIRNWSEDRFEEWLEETFPSGKIYREPEYWQDTRFNNPAQPVVGVTWFEARAYCCWLSAQTGQQFDLPTEVQFEAAARGQTGRLYPYGDAFEVSKSNTFESHIRRTTPVGIFDNVTPEGAFDLSGNAYTWTTTIYDQDQFPYPYRADDGRENISSSARRVVRGGSWYDFQHNARAVYRVYGPPGYRFVNYGFRVCRPPSL